MNVQLVGTVLSAFTSFLFVLLGWASLRSRQKNKEARRALKLQEVNIAAMEWAYQVRQLAASNGWHLPPLPKEMLPEYVIDGASDGDGGQDIVAAAKILMQRGESAS